MRIFRTLLLALLALAWVPLTSHCQIEAALGLDFLRCSTDEQAATGGGDPCKDEGCCSFEFAKYQSPRQQDVAPVVLLAIVPTDNIDVEDRSLPAQTCLGILTAAPPDLTSSWQFSFRTALPPRAPSFAS